MASRLYCKLDSCCFNANQMRNSLVIVVLILSSLSCKKDQVYKDSIGNTIDEAFAKDYIGFKFQGTYSLVCSYGVVGTSADQMSYDAKISMTPFYNQYTITPLKINNDYEQSKALGNFPILIDSTGSMTILDANVYLSNTVNGTGNIDVSTNTIHYYIRSVNNLYECTCNGTKK